MKGKKRNRKRNCFYVVDRWICEGYIDKYGFHLTEEDWDDEAYTEPWKLTKRERLKDIFFDEDEAFDEFERRWGRKLLIQCLEDKIDWSTMP